jgi:hypothetical protein
MNWGHILNSDVSPFRSLFSFKNKSKSQELSPFTRKESHKIPEGDDPCFVEVKISCNKFWGD